MIKKTAKIGVIASVLTMILLFNSLVSFGASQTNIKTSLTLDEAIKVGIENSQLIDLNRLDLEKKKVELSEARSQERKYKRSADDPFALMFGFPGSAGTFEGYMLEEEAASKGAKYAIEEGQMKEEFIKKSLETGITQAYYGVLQTEEAVDVEKATLENHQRNHDIIKKQLEVGTASKSELYMAEIALNEAKINLDKAKNTYNETLRALNNVLDYPLDTKLKLTSTYSENDNKVSLKDDIKYAMENRYDLIVAKNTKTLLELQMDITSGSYTPNTYKYKYAENTLKTYENRLSSIIKGIESDIRGKHDKIVSAKEEINLMKANVEKAKEGLRLSRLAYELGTGTSLEVKEAILMLNKAELGLANVIANYNISLIEYDKAINIGEF